MNPLTDVFMVINTFADKSLLTLFIRLNKWSFNMAQTQNPLSGYFRSPKMYTKIPSGGKYYDEKVIDWPDTGELAIFPMTAKDEMIMKNPDALLNGEAVAQVILSCVPAVKQPRKLIGNDVDTLLIAVQGATYGDEVTVEGPCTKCSHENSGVASIEECLDNMNHIEKSYEFETSQGLNIKVRPFTYDSTVKAGIANFKTTRSLQSLTNITDEIDQLKAFNANFIQIAALNFELIVDSVSSVSGTSPDGEEFVVTDSNAIREFLENCESSIGKSIEDKITDINAIGIDKKFNLQCEECGNVYEKEIAFDPVNFFTAS